MLIVALKIFKEGVAMGIGDNNGTVWGEYSLVGDKADILIDAVADVINSVDPIMGDRFTIGQETVKPKKRKKRQKKENGDDNS